MSSRRGAVLLAATVLLVAACSNDDTPASDERAEPTATTAKASDNNNIENSDWFRAACRLPRSQLRRIERGYTPGRSPDLMYVPDPRNYFNGFAHSGPWEHVQGVPLVLYGPGHIPASGPIDASREVTVADITPTLADLLETDIPRVDGNVLTEALEPDRPEPPRLIVVVVWDGGGTNVLERWPDAWPGLARLARNGTYYEGATVGSSPSVTPPIHATIGTGVFPNEHGIVDIPQRTGDKVADSWEGTSPKNLTAPSLADIYDLASNNEAVIGMFAERAWQLGMIGHGSAQEGGDRDIAVLTDPETDGGLITNEDIYELPEGLEDPALFERVRQEIDLEDGMLDDSWMGHEILDDPEHYPWTPVWTGYQTEIIKRLIRAENFGQDEVPDLFYVNYKQIDHIGHRWTMASPEMPEAISHADDALSELVDFLDSHVGRERWVLALTADHGAQPPPEDTQGWMIDQDPLTEAVEEHLGVAKGEVVLEDRPVGFWFTPEGRHSEESYAERAASFLTRYSVGDDLEEGETLPSYLSPTDRVFDAAFPMEHLPAILACARSS
jgi:predicted AlkP superfamily pyrophosphatase or phosphodiesterase